MRSLPVVRPAPSQIISSHQSLLPSRLLATPTQKAVGDARRRRWRRRHPAIAASTSQRQSLGKYVRPATEKAAAAAAARSMPRAISGRGPAIWLAGPPPPPPTVDRRDRCWDLGRGGGGRRRQRRQRRQRTGRRLCLTDPEHNMAVDQWEAVPADERRVEPPPPGEESLLVEIDAGRAQRERCRAQLSGISSDALVAFGVGWLPCQRRQVRRC